MATRLRFYLPAAEHGSAVPQVLAGLRAAMDRFRQRCRLAELDDRLLRDIGLTASRAREESDKPFWRGIRSE
jgi:uncharacterized protein YjiS (DUF1127 family)